MEAVHVVRPPMSFVQLDNEDTGETLLSREQVVLPCGCQVALGMMLPQGTEAMVVVPCGDEHIEKMVRLQSFIHLAMSTPKPELEGTPMAKVVLEIVEQMQ
jgi:hypothetical protein